MKDYISNLSTDIPAGIVVFFVAVPLCLGIALASGAPLFSGIIAGMVGGIVVGLLSGSQLGVSGPAAGLAVIVLTAIQDLGSYEVFLMAVVLAGVFQILLGVLRAGIIGYYFPSAVIKGMLAAIGIIIFLKQIPHAFGYDADYEGDLDFFQADGQNTFSELFNMVDYISPGATLVAFVSLAILILWEQSFMKKIKLFQIIQGPIVAVVAGIGFNLAFAGTDLAINHEHTVNLPVSQGLNGFFGQFTLPDFGAVTNSKVWVVALTMAIVASLETLLCVEATDKLDPQKRVTPTNRELLAQGIGNSVSGLIGGLPVTQVIVRSSANIQSGGKTKVSAVFHGLLILFSAMAIPNLLNLIPLSSLAAVLLVVGFKLAKPSLFKEMLKAGRIQFIPFIVTVVGIVFTDLLIGIALGMAVGVFHILFENLKTSYFLKQHEEGELIVIELSEHVTFLNKGAVLQFLENIEPGHDVKIDATRSVFVHPDVVEIIDNFAQSEKHKNEKIEVIGLDPEKSKYERLTIKKLVNQAS
ncbi:MAG: SulP family inorganic anion transporter [Flavobacteriales bacterium]|nr:SulP family inorganic anion transporter [Flavobacteriales bacterium]MCB9205031.1 SulP family inorganic anion transporter [Flavobacteriales bacterium]